MDTREVLIYHGPEVPILAAAVGPLSSPVVREPIPARLPWYKVRRNDPCPCGSGNKFKACCMARPPAPLAELELEKLADEAWRTDRQRAG